MSKILTIVIIIAILAITASICYYLIISAQKKDRILSDIVKECAEYCRQKFYDEEKIKSCVLACVEVELKYKIQVYQ